MNEVLWKPRRLVFATFFFVSAAGLLLIISLNLLYNGASEAGIFLGLSAERLLLIGGALVTCVGLLFVGLQTLRGRSFPFLRSPWGVGVVFGVALLVFCAAWAVTWIPAEKFGTFYYYLGRLYPFVIWLTCFSGGGFLLLLAHHFGLNIVRFKDFLREQRMVFTVAGLILLVFGLLAWGVSVRVVNMPWYEEDFWYGAGVPVLALQVLISVAISIAVSFLLRRFGKIEQRPWVDWLVFFAIWAIAAWLWVSEPVNPDFFITKPVAPNYELYPDYDAKFFDLFSQYALIGEELNTSIFFDRPLYSSLLVYLHSFFGQNYQQIIGWQTALFAVFAALAYLLGKQLHSRALGVGVAMLLALRGVNAIVLGPFISTAHQKQMMTDFPSAVLMLLMTVFLVKWLQEPARNWPSLFWAAGVLGMATLVRPHPLIYLPILIALIIWVYRAQKRIWFVFSSLILVVAFAGVFPWVWGGGKGQSLADLYLQKIKSVIETRYPDLHLPGSSALPSPLQVAALDDFYLSQIPTPPNKSIFEFARDHFLHNLLTTVQVLPYSPYYQDLRPLVKTSENFWQPYWDGTFSPWGWLMLPLNLLLIALGLGAAWKRARWAGLIPLMVMLAYYVMNSLARTSGGRYIVPVDWVVIVYYFLGIVALLKIVGTLLFRAQPLIQDLTQFPATVLLNRAAWLRILGVVVSFVLIGSLLPLSVNLYERRFPSLTRAELVRQVRKDTDGLGLSNQAWRTFLRSPDAVVVQGRALYPRQFEKDDGFKVSIYKFYYPKPYPRMLFTVIGPSGETSALLATMQAPALPNTSDVIILGCNESTYVQVWAILLDGGKQIIKRTPATAAESLTCPLQEPVCDNNHHCK